MQSFSTTYPEAVKSKESPKTEGLAIQVQRLSKRFGEVQAVDQVSFEVRKGQILSLLGPNGAGKSTTISMLACLLKPDKGDALVMGHSILHEAEAVKAAIGVVPQEIALYPDLSARENLQFWGKMYGLRGALLHTRVDEVLEVTGLADRQKGQVAKFSGGMKRRLNIGIALLNRPQVLYLDEPTVGIDPQSRRNILDSVRALNREGVSVLYTTHYMEEAQELSDYIVILDHGKVMASGTHQELVKIVGEQDRIELTLSKPASTEVKERWSKLDGVESLSVSEEGLLSLIVSDSNIVLPGLFETAGELGIRITSVQVKEPNLEAVFLHLTGRAIRDQ
ncbi:MAG TPA: ABC transporter ATP-binding protein [Chloroflexia bacterium]|nr:ABC transporter ATP-binding protein [Chloroflexia bacterium]